MTKAGCPFCNPYTRVIKSNTNAQIILSDPRKVPGHTLIVPKEHIEKPWLLTNDQLKDIFELIYYVEKKLIGKLGDGFDIRQNYRPYVKQNDLKLDHIHFQVIPRYLDDYLYKRAEKYETDVYAELDDTERKEVTKLLED